MTNNNPHAGWNNFFTVSAAPSSQSSDGAAANAVDGNTYDFWVPAAFPATLTAELPAPATATYVGIAAHNLGTLGCGVAAEYWDGAAWVELWSASPVDDSTIGTVLSPVTATQFRLVVTAGNNPAVMPSIGVAHIGAGLTFERRLYQGHTPIVWGRTTEIKPTISDGGQFLGRSVIRRGLETNIEIAHLGGAWSRTAAVENFLEHAVVNGWFWFWRPGDYPGDVAYVWTPSGEISRTNSGPGGLVSMTIPVVGYRGVG